MSEKRFTDIWCSETGHIGVTDYGIDKEFTSSEFEDLLNKLYEENEKLRFLIDINSVSERRKLERQVDEQQELIEELEVSDEMGWKRAEYFEKKCPKELHNKKMYIKRLEYKVQKFKEMNSEQQVFIEHLKERLYDFEKRKIIEESEIDEDVIPKVKLLRSELFGEKYE